MPREHMDENSSLLHPATNNHVGGASSIGDSGPNDPVFEYKPLPSKVDGMRLIRINHAGNGGPIECSMQHVLFGNNPKYHALSYAWGDQTTQKIVYINGRAFSVGQNLFSALEFLRSRKQMLPVWIDALCINQRDIPERNKQVKIMRHIYNRAEEVLVWLGPGDPNNLFFALMGKCLTSLSGLLTNMFSCVPRREANKRPGSTVGQNSTRPRTKNYNALAISYAKLCQAEYWNRLWIIQEIIEAHSITVCFQNGELGWDDFISALPPEVGEIPRSLDEQRKMKHHRNLREIIEKYRKAGCKDPRDKVYGLVALASNFHDFPAIDYNKSAFQVWKDTLSFSRAHGMVDKPVDFIQFARLLKSILGGTSMVDQNTILQQRQRAPEDSRYYVPGPLHISAEIIGKITYLGPSVADLLSDLHSAERWKVRIQKAFPHEIKEANRENDNLGHALRTISHESLRNTIFPYHSAVSCHMTNRTLIKGYRHSGSSREDTETQQRPGPIRLYLMQHRSHKTRWKMGLVPSNAEVGDLICWVGWNRDPLLLRARHGNIRVVGTASVTESLSVRAGTPLKERLSRTYDIDETIGLSLDLEDVYVFFT